MAVGTGMAASTGGGWGPPGELEGDGAGGMVPPGPARRHGHLRVPPGPVGGSRISKLITIVKPRGATS